MTLAEFAAAAAIAAYAMAGGALFGAAITRPANCLHITGKLIPWAWGVGGAVTVAVATWGTVNLSRGQAFNHGIYPLDYVTAGHMPLLALLYLSRWIARSLTSAGLD